MLISPIVSSGQTQFSNSIYITTLDGIIYKIDSPNDIELIYEFDATPSELRVEISQHGGFIGYAVNNDMDWVVGVIDINTLESAEITLDKDYEINNIQLDWLPTNRLFVSYIDNTENNGHSLVGRDLVTFTSLANLELIDFPYNCIELIHSNADQLSLQCRLFQEIEDKTLVEYVTLPLQNNEVYLEMEASGTIVHLEDMLQKNWIWNTEVGVSFFDAGINELERGFYIIPQEMSEPQHLNIEITWTSGFDVSSDGNLIYEEAQSGNWIVHNILGNEVVDTIEIPNLDRLAGVSWYDNSQITYSTYDRIEGVSTIHIVCLCGDELTFEIEGIVAGITVIMQDT